MKSGLLKFVARILTLVFIFDNVAFAHKPMVSVWEERQKAGLQTSANPHVLPSTSFTPSSAATSLNTKKYPEFLAQLPNDFFSHVNVHDISVNGHGPAVVLIEDVHQNLEAQTHISNAIKSLSQMLGQGQTLIALEGAHGGFIYEKFKQFPIRSASVDVANQFLTSGEISGPAHAGFTHENTDSHRALSFWGVDDPAQYQANVAAYRASRINKDEVSDGLNKWSLRLAHGKKTIFNSKLKEFDLLADAYHHETLSMGDYALKMAPLNSWRSENLSKFLQAYQLEKSLDFARVETERRTVLETLVPRLTKTEINDLTATSLAYQQGGIGFADYYRTLSKLCENKGVRLAQTPKFDAYVRYVLLADGIKADALFKDIQTLEQKIYGHLASTPAEKQLVAESRQLTLTRRLTEFALTSEEWSEYKADGASGRGGEWEKNLKPFEQFYVAADARSQKMIENLLSAPVAHSPTHPRALSVMVAGGFHTSELAHLLGQQNINYAVVTPKLTKLDGTSASAYLSVFERERTPLEKIFSGQKLFLTQPVAGAAESIDPHVVDPTSKLVLDAAVKNVKQGGAVSAVASVLKAVVGKKPLLAVFSLPLTILSLLMPASAQPKFQYEFTFDVSHLTDWQAGANLVQRISNSFKTPRVDLNGGLLPLERNVKPKGNDTNYAVMFLSKEVKGTPLAMVQYYYDPAAKKLRVVFKTDLEEELSQDLVRTVLTVQAWTVFKDNVVVENVAQQTDLTRCGFKGAKVSTTGEKLSHTAPSTVPFSFYSLALPSLILAAVSFWDSWYSPILTGILIAIVGSTLLIKAVTFLFSKIDDNSEVVTEGEKVGEILKKIDLGAPARRTIARFMGSFMPTKKTYDDIAHEMSKQFEIGWGRASGDAVDGYTSIDALRTYVTQPTGQEKGPRLVVEWGGTNRHITLWDLQGNGKSKKIVSIDEPFEADRLKNPILAFKDIAQDVKEIVNEHYPDAPVELEFTFGFPADISTINSATAKRWSKGWIDPVDGVRIIGADIVQVLQSELTAIGVNNVTVKATANDTLNPMMEATYKELGSGRYKIPFTMSIVLGTGFNIALDHKGDIRNLEAGNFDGVRPAMNELDKYLDANTPDVNSGSQLIEKMVTGNYIGELFRLSLASISEKTNGVYFPWISQMKPWSVKGELLSKILAQSGGLDLSARSNDLQIENLLMGMHIMSSPEERAVMVLMAKVLMRRSAYLVASAIKGLVDVVDPKYKEVHKIAVVGSVYEKVPGYQEFLNQALRELMGSKSKKIIVVATPTGPGGAIIAATASEKIPGVRSLTDTPRFQHIPIFNIAFAIPFMFERLKSWIANLNMDDPWLEKSSWFNVGSFKFPSTRIEGIKAYKPLTPEMIRTAYLMHDPIANNGYAYQVVETNIGHLYPIFEVKVTDLEKDNLLVGSIKFVYIESLGEWHADVQVGNLDYANDVIVTSMDRLADKIGVERILWNSFPNISGGVISASGIASKWKPGTYPVTQSVIKSGETTYMPFVEEFVRALALYGPAYYILQKNASFVWTPQQEFWAVAGFLAALFGMALLHFFRDVVRNRFLALLPMRLFYSLKYTTISGLFFAVIFILLQPTFAYFDMTVPLHFSVVAAAVFATLGVGVIHQSDNQDAVLEGRVTNSLISDNRAGDPTTDGVELTDASAGKIVKSIIKLNTTIAGTKKLPVRGIRIIYPDPLEKLSGYDKFGDAVAQLASVGLIFSYNAKGQSFTITWKELTSGNQSILSSFLNLAMQQAPILRGTPFRFTIKPGMLKVSELKYLGLQVITLTPAEEAPALEKAAPVVPVPVPAPAVTASAPAVTQVPVIAAVVNAAQTLVTAPATTAVSLNALEDSEKHRAQFYVAASALVLHDLLSRKLAAFNHEVVIDQAASAVLLDSIERMLSWNQAHNMNTTARNALLLSIYKRDLINLTPSDELLLLTYIVRNQLVRSGANEIKDISSVWSKMSVTAANMVSFSEPYGKLVDASQALVAKSHGAMVSPDAIVRLKEYGLYDDLRMKLIAQLTDLNAVILDTVTKLNIQGLPKTRINNGTTINSPTGALVTAVGFAFFAMDNIPAWGIALGLATILVGMGLIIYKTKNSEINEFMQKAPERRLAKKAWKSSEYFEFHSRTTVSDSAIAFEMAKLAPDVEPMFARTATEEQVKFLRTPTIYEKKFHRMAWMWSIMGFLMMGEKKAETLGEAVESTQANPFEKANILTYLITPAHIERDADALEEWIKANPSTDVVIPTLGLSSFVLESLQKRFERKAIVVAIDKLPADSHGYSLFDVLKLAADTVPVQKQRIWYDPDSVRAIPQVNTLLVTKSSDIKIMLVSNGVPFYGEDWLMNSVALILSIGGLFIPVPVNTSVEAFKLAEKAA